MTVLPSSYLRIWRFLGVQRKHHDEALNGSSIPIPTHPGVRWGVWVIFTGGFVCKRSPVPICVGHKEQAVACSFGLRPHQRSTACWLPPPHPRRQPGGVDDRSLRRRAKPHGDSGMDRGPRLDRTHPVKRGTECGRYVPSRKRESAEAVAWRSMRGNEQAFFRDLARKHASTNTFAASVAKRPWITPGQAAVLRKIEQEASGRGGLRRGAVGDKAVHKRGDDQAPPGVLGGRPTQAATDGMADHAQESA
jgi:hypothetical protein